MIGRIKSLWYNKGDLNRVDLKIENKQNEKFRFSEEMESFIKEQLKEGCSIAEVTITVKGLDFTATQI